MIELRDVRKSYRSDEPPALDGVSLQIGPGEVVALLGPSGAGKSTLIRCLNGLVRPDAGTVSVAGQPVHALAGAALRELRRQVGMVFQEFHLIDRLSVLQNVMVGRFGRYPFWRAALGLYPPADVALAQQALERVGLGALARHRARELSGGQRQRVAVARALVQEPQVILGDEPVSSLDPVTAREVLDLLTGLSRAAGITLVLSLHDVELARAYCGRAVGLAAGRVVYDGPVARLTEAAVDRIYAAGGRPAARALPPAVGGTAAACAPAASCR